MAEDEIVNTKAQSLTVGELRAYLEGVPDDLPVITYVHADIFAADEDYGNVTHVCMQDYEIVVLEVATVTDNRGW